MTARILGLRTKLGEVSQKLNSLDFPERFKGTILEKWKNYWKQLMLDYREVVVDVGKEMKAKPLKAAVYGSILGTTYICYKKNPSEEDFKNQLLFSNSQIILVHESCQNLESAQHLRFLERCYNEGIVRRLTLGVVSFIWLDNFDEGAAIYKAMCPYLKPRYLTFHERIVDIGFWDKWWTLDRKMIDYDVNF